MKKLSILGVPMDLGASRRGVDMGPSAVRSAKLGERLELLGFQVRDRGNIEVNVRESLADPHGSKGNARYVEEIATVSKSLAKQVRKILEDGERPVVVGGDHSIALGSISGIAEYYHQKGKKIGVVWMDAHADINTPDTSPSGNVHGMPVAHLLGFGDPRLLKVSELNPVLDSSKVVLVGLRDIDTGERKTLRDRNIHVFTMREIDELGMREVMKRSIEIAGHDTAGIHVSFDLDCVDPSIAPGVGTPVPGGVTYREAHLSMEMISDSGKLISMEVTEINPLLDQKNQTGNLAVEVILSAFGKRIL